MMNNDLLRVMGGAGAKAQYGHVGKSYDGDLSSEFQQTRNRGTDTEHERKAVRSNAAQHSMGMMNSLASERVMEQAMADKFAQAGVKTTMDQAWQARPEEGDDAKSDASEDPDQDSSLAALRAARLAEMKKNKSLTASSPAVEFYVHDALNGRLESGAAKVSAMPR